MQASDMAPRWRVALIAVAVALLLAGCTNTPLYSNLEEQQANDLMAALLGAGVPAEKSLASNKTSWEVKVDRGDFPKAMQILRANGLPHARYVSMCETFKKEGFASSSIEEKARYQCSLQEELARTLSQIPGVAEARVHIALPERDPLGNETADSSASVTIFEQPGANVRDRETDIKVTVKDSIEGLDDVNKVTVKFFTLGAPTAGTQSGSASRISLSSLSPLAIGIAVIVAALLALGVALTGRMRKRAQAAAAPKPSDRVWNG